MDVMYLPVFQDCFIDAGDSMIAPYAGGVNLNDIGKID